MNSTLKGLCSRIFKTKLKVGNIQCFGTDMAYEIYLFCNLQVLSNVIIIKAKVLLPRAYMYVILADFDYPGKALLSGVFPERQLS